MLIFGILGYFKVVWLLVKMKCMCIKIEKNIYVYVWVYSISVIFFSLWCYIILKNVFLLMNLVML